MNQETLAAHQRLEERVTYCERLVDTLNEVVTDLQKRLLALEQQNRKLLAEFQRQQESARAIGESNERPPHY